MAKINCLNPIAQVGLDNLPANYELTDDFAAAQGVLVRSAKMHDMELSDNLLAIARAGAGVNNIPLDKCAQKGIVVFNTPGANANGVKELVIAGMLMAARDIVGGIEWVQANKDDADIAKDMEKAKKAFAGYELKGKKLGIIGLGAIGILVANTARHFGMEVYGCDPFLSVNNALKLSRDVKVVGSNDEIFQTCDYITVHVPLMDSTKGLINKAAIDQMKDGVVILNFARDILCDEEAVLAGIESGKIRKYVSDFPNATTAGKKGVILTPHLGASTEESEDNCAVMAVDEIVDFIDNGNIRNSVNYPAVNLGPATMPARVCVAHKNIPNVISGFTSLAGANGVNIENMVSASRGEYSYAIFDLTSKVTEDFVEKAEALEGVLKVRVIEK
ncbi:MAG: 3-phosphoglycerate dehydrogenase [Lachnospiraceae bacterium]|nr:3-phosphoglycerate dehydrogenase [Lachnospiraceae bacterium]